MSVIRSYFFCFLAIDNDIMRKMCTLITSKATDIDENIANQNHAHVHRNRGIVTSLMADVFVNPFTDSTLSLTSKIVRRYTV